MRCRRAPDPCGAGENGRHMSAPPVHALDAIAFQLAAALDAYDVAFDALLNHGDLAHYEEAGRWMDQLKMYSGALPQLSVQYVNLLIAHAELVHCLWKNAKGTGDGSETLAKARATQRQAITGLRRKCLQLLADHSGRAGGRGN
jgi:hypothetical protein